MLKMALGFRSKSETPALAGRSTKGQACPSHIKSNESLHTAANPPHPVCRSGSCSQNRPLGTAGVAGKKVQMTLFFFFIFFSENYIFPTATCTPKCHQLSKSKNSKQEHNKGNKNGRMMNRCDVKNAHLNCL